MNDISIKIVNFFDVEKEWKELYSDNASITPYMSYEFQSVYRKFLQFGVQRLGARYLVLGVYNE